MSPEEITLATLVTDLRTHLAVAKRINEENQKINDALILKNKRRLENYRKYKYSLEVYKELYEKERQRTGCKCYE